MMDARILSSPSAAASAYARVQGQSPATADLATGDASSATGASSDFGATLSRAIEGVIQTGHEADSEAAKGLTGQGNLTDVVMAVSRAQMALQSTTAIRDRVVQAYQDIMKMSI